MKKFVPILFVLLFVAALMPATAANRMLDFKLLNRTGLTIDELYISANTVNDWEEDVLGRDVLADGESVTIHFDRYESSRLWDIKIVDEDGDEYEWFEIPLDEVNELQIYFTKDGTAMASWR